MQISEKSKGLSKEDKDMLAYAASVWAKNIDFMNSVSMVANGRYLAVLQPTLGIGGDYCANGSQECMLSNSRYIARMKYLYSILRKHCSARDYCLDISNDTDLTTNESLYTDPRHPNSEGNKKIAHLIRERVIQELSD